jgi:hypothetical protein
MILYRIHQNPGIVPDRSKRPAKAPHVIAASLRRSLVCSLEKALSEVAVRRRAGIGVISPSRPCRRLFVFRETPIMCVPWVRLGEIAVASRGRKSGPARHASASVRSFQSTTLPFPH